jgi:hypothetical protein
MKTHNILMAILVVLGIVLVFVGPAFNVGAGFGLLLLICPLMMLGMMFFMGNNHDKH